MIVTADEVGDQVLRQVAAIIRNNLRTSDFLARFGGEGFVILMPETAPAGAEQLADRIRLAIAAEELPSIGRAMTASFGVTSTAGSEEAKAVLKRADKALCQAKNTGRDRVVVVSA